ncbi:uncharacterized protein L203_105589 [Cryptococcus depauperatus CBS 7841]|uniref:Leucine repeat containing protein n=1 Tax=Cryptococcus depauperatus CBS 7841 TaxID=1295531 RepID=A0AAJ8JXL6_9TREE
MAYTAPGWATDELLEEWPESSPSPPPTINKLSPIPNSTANMVSSKAKRGSLRMLGQAAARPLPPSRSTSSASFGREDPPTRIVSGHVDGGRGHVSGTGLDAGVLSPPSSISSSGEIEREEPPAGTFMVKEGVEDDRGAHLARNGIGVKGKDIFGALPLERMFDPPSPPVGAEDQQPSGISSQTTTFAQNSAAKPVDIPRKASHQYAPPIPSRLSKSVTPSSNDSFNTTVSSTLSDLANTDSLAQQVSNQAKDTLIGNSALESDQDKPALTGGYNVGLDKNVHQIESRSKHENTSNRDNGQSKDESPFSHPDSQYPFTFESPHRSTSSSDGRRYSLKKDSFDPERDAIGEGPSHSTLNLRSKSGSNQQQLLTGRIPVNPALRLFRSTYDTYTREYLSAMADSIAIESSPSPPNIPSARGLHHWSPATDSSASPSRVFLPSQIQSTSTPSDLSDARSSKRLRLSPASPPTRKALTRDWGAQGRAMMDRLRNVEASTDAASASRSSGNDSYESDAAKGPEVNVDNDMPPTISDQNLPPSTQNLRSSIQQSSDDRPTTHSIPSTTSSGYLRAAEDIMARIKQRKVSESASDSPMVRDRRVFSESDENRIWEEQAHQYLKSKGKAKGTLSPKTLRSSASEEVNGVERQDSREGDSPGLSIKNHYPRQRLEERRPTGQSVTSSNNIASGPTTISQAPQFTADDINRYMSSSTLATSTTVSTSFVKHRGPRAAPSPHLIRMIRPDDVQGVVPDKIGKMRYDKTGMRWVRELGPVDEAGESKLTGSEESEDVFAGMESLAADNNPSIGPSTMIASELDNSLREHREQLKNNADDEATPQTRLQYLSSSTNSSENEDGDRFQPQPLTHLEPVLDLEDASSLSSSESSLDEPTPRPPSRMCAFHHDDSHRSPIRSATHSHIPASAIMTPTPSAFAPRPIRSALRNGNSTTPANGPKKRQGWYDETPGLVGKGTTPGSGVKRSVSFSDGKKTGKIVDLELEVKTARWTAREEEGNDLFIENSTCRDRSFLPSIRTKRIQGMLDDMGNLSLDNETPSKPPLRYTDRLDRPCSRASLTHSSDSELTVPIHSVCAGRSFAHRPNNGDATFLTECSFGVAHDKLVEIITDVEPFNPHWEGLKALDLKNKGADSVARLKEFLPNLDWVNLDGNTISYLSGIPSTVRTLHVAGNRLSSLTSVHHLKNLQYLDISGNQLDSVAQLECLIHIRELKIDNNAITDFSGILQLDSLIKLSCENNKIQTLDLSEAQWSKMESLNLSNNTIKVIKELHKLSSAASINLDGNQLDNLAPAKSMPNVRVLRFSDNNISRFDISLFPKVRTLYADNNLLTRIECPDQSPSSRLENLSVRNQRVEALHLDFLHLENLKRLYVSGNPIKESFFPHRPLYSLVYLEAAGCKITQWPRHFSVNMPHLKMLNLNYNYLTNLEAIKGLKELRKLTLVGGRLGDGTKSADTDNMADLGELESLEELDLRMNPSTLSLYFPLLLPTSSPLFVLDPSTHRKTSTGTSEFPAAPATVWHHYDTQYRKNLPNEWYSKRLLYRGLIMRTCKRIKKLDGAVIEDKERRKAEKLMTAALDLRRS